MAYCRFSTDDFRCDFYAYEGADGFHLHIAGMRIVWDPPASPYDLRNLAIMPHGDWDKMLDEYNRQLQAAPRETIRLEGAGESHTFSTLPELRQAIAEHIQRGFLAPDGLLDMIGQDIQQDISQDTQPEGQTKEPVEESP